MSGQRVISESTGLYRLSIVNKQKNTANEVDSANQEPLHTEMPKKGLPLQSPIRSTANKENSAQSDLKQDLDNPNSFSDKLLYDLATKRRQVVELKEQLSKAERELDTLEHKFEARGESGNALLSPEKFQMLTSRLQQKIEDVNSNPRVIKSKQSISNFFQPRRVSTEPSANTPESKPSRLQFTSNKVQNQRQQQSQAPFLDKLRSKWQEFAVNEQDEDKFDSERPVEEYYIKSKLDYDDEEEIPTETESDAESKLSDMGGQPVISTFKRNSEAS
ncbi:LANO_0G07184g1_1 [Lachancea nothofagi CBS 11611]|uniref:LANO_0G07184g1_1 n=1 Tax=Lachancea nothofagi CBS 11611 TaxID=1266666 RepID=A0A1G4KHA9_9SACH|nr:LANO_0G07184g1_1 [Lachancea nothofagi CBS 11611]